MLTFPIDISANWHQNFAKLSSLQSQWLLETGSLTAKLKMHFSNFKVQVLSEKNMMLTPEQASVMGIEIQEVLCREVILIAGNQARVYAQSWIPLASLNRDSEFLNLGDKPLGEFIFQHPNLERDNLMVASVTPGKNLTALFEQFNLNHENCLARRSIFQLNGLRLMVCEAFLPGAIGS